MSCCKEWSYCNQMFDIEYDIKDYPWEYWQEIKLGWLHNYKIKRLVKEFGFSAIGLISFAINEELDSVEGIDANDLIFAAADYSGETEATIKKMFRRMSEYGLITDDRLKGVIDGKD